MELSLAAWEGSSLGVVAPVSSWCSGSGAKKWMLSQSWGFDGGCYCSCDLLRSWNCGTRCQGGSLECLQ